jgi:hypothetical protein
MAQELETVDKETGEIVTVAQEDRRLVFGTQNPEHIIERAVEVANRLKNIVEAQKLYTPIQGKKYVRVEGWTAMLAMLGIFPSSVYCHRLDRNKDEITYEAKVLLRHLSGHQLGAGEAICSSNESNWHNRDEYAIKSMAQTRAVGKAARLSFSWIMTLAGYEPCNEEEIPKTEDLGPPIPAPEAIGFPSSPAEVEDRLKKPISEKQQKYLFFMWKQGGHKPEELALHLKAKYGLEHSKDLKHGQLQEILELLEQEQKQRA